jgi:hypothetical protein
MKTHVCIIDSEPVSSITPLIDRKSAPEAVIFAFPKNNINIVLRLELLIKPRGIKVFRWELPESILVDKYKLSFLSLLDEFSEHELSFNASCGARHINLAAYEIFRLYKKNIFCVEPNTDLISWIYPDNKQPQEIDDRLKISHYVNIFGAEVVNNKDKEGVKKPIRDFCLDWLARSDEYQFAIRALNYLAGSAMNSEYITAHLNSKQLANKHLDTLINDLVSIDYCQRKGSQIIFKNDDTRLFANGGWLEVAVFSLIRKFRVMHRFLQDDGQSLEIIQNSNKNYVKNEIDVAFLANNKLHLIECKTKKFSQGEGNNVIYKLETLADLLGGLHAKAMLISYLPMSDADKLRAKYVGVEIVDSSNLHYLESILSNWILEAKR